jgi:hypothetical protein
MTVDVELPKVMKGFVLAEATSSRLITEDAVGPIPDRVWTFM